MAQETPTTESQTQTEGRNNGPVQTLRHKGVFIKLWKQEGPREPFITTTIGKTYKDKTTGEFKEGHSFTEADLAKLDILTQDARREMAHWKEYLHDPSLQNEHRAEAEQFGSNRTNSVQAHNTSQTPKQTAHTDMQAGSRRQAPLSEMTTARDQAMSQAAPRQSTPVQGIKHER